MIISTVRLALRNLGRNVRRTLLSVVGSGIGCAIAVTLTGWLPRRDDKLRLVDGPAALQRVRAMPGVRVAAPRARMQGLLAMGTRVAGVELTGVDPVAEPRALRFVRDAVKGRYLQASDGDAVRVDASLGAHASAEVVGVAGANLDGCAIAGRLRGYVGPVDAEIVGGWRARDGFVGATASGSVGGAEVHGELAALFLPEPWRWGGALADDKVILKAVAGAWYNFDVGDGLRLVGEYHYSGFGVTFPVSALDLAADRALRMRLNRGDTQILGRHMLAVVVNHPLMLTLSAAVQGLCDPTDGSGVVAPTLVWDLAENASLVAGGYAGWGAAPRRLCAAQPIGRHAARGADPAACVRPTQPRRRRRTTSDSGGTRVQQATRSTASSHGSTRRARAR